MHNIKGCVASMISTKFISPMASPIALSITKQKEESQSKLHLSTYLTLISNDEIKKIDIMKVNYTHFYTTSLSPLPWRQSSCPSSL